MTYDPKCPGCRVGRQITAGTAALIVFGVPLFGARETGWLHEEPLPAAYHPDPMDNSTVSASASVRTGDSSINAGWIVIRTDQVPDRRDG
ncbi:hypothetical protein [Phytohabitans houttuyneae]|nr:hypothetical protein [Phytohabitans houttuyneae]